MWTSHSSSAQEPHVASDTILDSAVLDILLSLTFWKQSLLALLQPFLLRALSLLPLPAPHMLLVLRISPLAILFFHLTLSPWFIYSTYWLMIPKVICLSPTSQFNLQLV